MNNNIVYALLDPRNDLVYYVGKSTIGTKRPLTHLYKSHSSKVNEWVEDLKTKGFDPDIYIIEENIDLFDLIEREKYWIIHYKYVNPNLLNIFCFSKLLKITNTQEERDEFELLSTYINNLGSIVFKQRILRNISQDELARNAGISRSTISLIERNRNASLSSIKKCLSELQKHEISKNHNQERAGKFINPSLCDHPFERTHKINDTIFCNKCGKKIR